jgi:hypothetical protein
MSINISKSQKQIFGVFALLAVSIFGFFGFMYFRPVAIVGDWKIYKKDIQYRDQIIQLNFPEEKRSMGLYQLTKSAINYAILKNNGVNIHELQIEDELQRIDAKTKNPEQLDKIKKIFKDDREAYKKDFVLPALVDGLIYYEFFLKDPSVQADSLNRTAKFIEEAQKPQADFKKLAAQNKLAVRKLIVSLKNGLTWIEPEKEKNQKSPRDRQRGPERGRERGPKMKVINNQNPNQPLLDRVNEHLHLNNPERNVEDAKKWYDEVIEPMKPGAVTSSPISQDEQWLVVHYVGKNKKDDHELEIVAIKKLNYNQWYENEKSKVSIIINDKSRLVP